jgi:hypothetical protein
MALQTFIGLLSIGKVNPISLFKISPVDLSPGSCTTAGLAFACAASSRSKNLTVFCDLYRSLGMTKGKRQK